MTVITGAAGPIDLGGNPRRHRRERWIRRGFLTAALSSIAISLAIVASLLGESINFLRDVDLASLWSTGWYPRDGVFDVKTLFVGSLLVTGVAMLIATPLGLGAAIYLSEYARPRTRKILKPILEVLAGMPSIVIGFFAFTWISPEVVRRFSSEATPFNMAAAGIGVGILVTPLIASVAEDAMRAVPRALREASYGLGARRATTSLRVVFPAAVSGVVAALLLGASRAIGETMVVALAAGASGGTKFTTDVLGPGQTITAAMASLAAGTDQVTGANSAFNSLFFLGLLLFAITFLLNAIGAHFVNRVRERY
jgi:phosphate transport system permease protein